MLATLYLSKTASIGGRMVGKFTGAKLRLKYNILEKDTVENILIGDFVEDYEEIDGKEKQEVNAVYFKNHVMQSLRTLFGEVGGCIIVDVLKYNPEEQRAVLRVPASSYVKLHASLTLCGEYENTACAYRVHNTSPCLLSFLGNSRTYHH